MNQARRALEFPPLLTGIAVTDDPFQAALQSVADEVEPGAVFYGVDPARMQAAIVLAPEEPLQSALRVSFAVALGLNDALGALAPPEVGVHLVWPDRIKVNGAFCGTLAFAASTREPGDEPDWLIVGLEMPLVRPAASEPGHDPDRTALYEEGCSDIALPDLIEAWGRHMMNWLHIYLTEGFEPLHREWRAKGDGLGGEVTYPQAGTFVGLDENGGMILKTGETTRILSLADRLAR
ncbi:MAG: biotin/lipoate--protein ligase family protein [Silicimonas sp.]